MICLGAVAPTILSKFFLVIIPLSQDVLEWTRCIAVLSIAFFISWFLRFLTSK